MLRVAIIAVFHLAILAQAAEPADSAVFTAFRHADAQLAHFVSLRRTEVTEQLDLVISIGSAKTFPPETNAWVWWGEDRKIGLFLQEKARPDRVYLLGIKSGFPDCAARVERSTDTDTVISCKGEKSERYPNQKWVYDVRAKSLLRQFSYRPFAFTRVFPSRNGAIFVGSDGQRTVTVSGPPFRILSTAAVSREEKKPPPAALSALPRTIYEQFAAARPERVKQGYKREGITFDDSIGPWQREGERIWFAKNFYDGEGTTGVGGFGYFDTAGRKLHLFQPPEIADWSVLAMSVGGDAVWMALVENEEYGSSSGGLLRYDRKTEALHKVALPDITASLVQDGNEVLAATDFGLAVVNGDEVERDFVDVTSDGRLRIARATIMADIH